MNTSGIYGRLTLQEEKLPKEGSEGLFHDVSLCFSLLLVSLLVSFIPGSIVSEACCILCHKMFPFVVSKRTSLPKPENVDLVLLDVFETFDDQMSVLCPFNTTRFPSSDIVTTPEESFSGWFLLATHMTVDGDFHQIPT